VRTILNVIWLVFCGVWMAIAYAAAGLIAFVLIITIPFGIAAFRIAGYVLWPFGRTIEPRRDAGMGSLIGNIIWIVLFGWWLAIGHLVTGVMLVALYGPSTPIGGFLADHGLQVVFAVPGIFLALLVITLPLVVRTVEPVLLELDVAQEEAAHVLGAGGWTTFRRVVLPAIRPAIAAGILLSFARAIGEFGSIVIVSGNITGKTLTAPYFIFQLTSQFKYAEAAAVSTLLFGISAVLVFVTERLVSSGRSDR